MRQYFILLLSIFCLMSSPAFAFWIWTPETRQWVNPKYSVKETPQKQLAYALEFAAQEEYKTAEQEMQKLIKYYPKAREAAEAQFYIAEFQEKQGNFAQAFKSYELVLQKYPFTDRANDVVTRQYEMGSRLLEGTIGQKTGFWSKVTSSDVNVEKIFTHVIKNAPYGEYAPSAQYKIGLFLKEEGLLQEARDAFEKTVNDYPDSEWAKAARYQIALADAERSAGAAYDQQITETAIQGFKEFVKDYPEAQLSEQAQERIAQLKDKEAENSFLVAQFYEKQKQLDAAATYYSSIVSQYEGTIWAQKASDRLNALGKK